MLQKKSLPLQASLVLFQFYIARTLLTYAVLVSEIQDNNFEKKKGPLLNHSVADPSSVVGVIGTSILTNALTGGCKSCDEKFVQH